MIFGGITTSITNNGTIIKANSASGIRTVNNLTITDVDLYTNHSSGYGIYVESGSLTMNGGTITTKGYSSNSIFLK